MENNTRNTFQTSGIKPRSISQKFTGLFYSVNNIQQQQQQCIYLKKYKFYNTSCPANSYNATLGRTRVKLKALLNYIRKKKGKEEIQKTYRKKHLTYKFKDASSCKLHRVGLYAYNSNSSFNGFIQRNFLCYLKNVLKILTRFGYRDNISRFHG